MRDLVELQAFPAALAAGARAVVLALAEEEPHAPSGQFQVLVNGEQLSIPTRVYYDPGRVTQCIVSNGREGIALCLGSRHHDGYLRERCLKDVILVRQTWAVPFVVQLIGEYVLPITQVIAQSIPEMDLSLYQQFAAENPAYCALVGKRVISYWTVYHRQQFPRLDDYPGFRAYTALVGPLQIKHQTRRLRA